MHPLALTYDETVRLFRQYYDRGPFHAAAWYRFIFQTTASRSTDAPAFISHADSARRIEADFRFEMPGIVTRQDEDGVAKLVLRLSDGHEIETVIISMPGHVTVCISSQVGCRMGCRFCQTGRMGLQRQLRAEEIVAQVYLVQATLGLKVRNVVFMGMGEPLDNWEPVMQAVRVLNDQRGFNIALRRITLSTIGPVPALARLAAMNQPQLGLAISLNAAEDRLRHHLMPATGLYTLEEVKCTLQTYRLAKGRVFFIAYVLIRGLNDSEHHARQTAALLKGLPVKVNLIVYNSGDGSVYRAPSADRVERFRRILVDDHYFVRLRGTKGDHIQAACGQLGHKPLQTLHAPTRGGE